MERIYNRKNTRNFDSQSGGELFMEDRTKSIMPHSEESFKKGETIMGKKKIKVVMTKAAAVIFAAFIGFVPVSQVQAVESTPLSGVEAGIEDFGGSMSETEDNMLHMDEPEMDFVVECEEKEADDAGDIAAGVSGSENQTETDVFISDECSVEGECRADADISDTDDAADAGECKDISQAMDLEVTVPEENTEFSENVAVSENDSEVLVGSDEPVATTREDLVKAIRHKLVLHKEEFSVYHDLPKGEYSPKYYREVFEEAQKAHTGIPYEGDFLSHKLIGGVILSTFNSKGECQIIQNYKYSEMGDVFTRSFLDAAFETEYLGMGTDYEIVRKIHDFVCKSLTFNSNYVPDEEKNTEDNVYEAFLGHKPAYNAYAPMFYYLALKAGIDCRVVEGTFNGVEHTWNIVKIGKCYYNVDTALDDKFDTTSYFLKSESSFADHVRYDDYRTSAFYKAYPMTTKNYPIKEKVSIDAASVHTKSASYEYTGSPRRPIPVVTLGGKTLEWDKDFTVSYKDNTNVGTAEVTVTGIGNYTGTATTEFKLKRRSLSNAYVKTKADSYTYTGYTRSPKPVVKDNGKELKLDRDYTLSYKNNKNVGTATVIVKGIGNYQSTTQASFRITRCSLSGASVSTKSPSYPVTGKARCPKPIVKLGNQTLELDKDYTLSYKNNVKVGTAVVIVTGKGNYSGTVKGTFKLVKSK